MQQRRVRQHRTRYASADLAPKPQGGHVAAARDGKVAGALMPLSLTALAANHEQTVAVSQLPKSKIVQYMSHALTIPTSTRTIQEQTKWHTATLFWRISAPRHKLATSPKILRRTMADFCGFQRVANLWRIQSVEQIM